MRVGVTDCGVFFFFFIKQFVSSIADKESNGSQMKYITTEHTYSHMPVIQSTLPKDSITNMKT